MQRFCKYGIELHAVISGRRHELRCFCADLPGIKSIRKRQTIAMQSNSLDIDPEISEPLALRRLRQFAGGRRDVVSRGYAGRQIANLVADPGIRTRDLVDVALADPAVVVRLVRMANGFSYQTRDRSDVVSIQRSIELMGQVQVRELVRALPDIEEFVPKDRLIIVGDELAKTMFCARFARNLLDTRNPLVSDEGAVITILACLWELVGSLHMPHELAAVRYVYRNAPKLAENIHRELFGLNPVLLNKEIITAWGLPLSVHATIVQADQRPAPVIAGRDWLPLAVGIALRAAEAIRQETPAAREQYIREIVVRYRKCVDFDQKNLTEFIEECAYETISMERSIGIPESMRCATKFLQPFLKREKVDESGWEHFERVDSTGVIARLRNRRMRQESSSGGGLGEVIMRTATGKPTDSIERIQARANQFAQVCNDYAVAQRDGYLDIEQTPAVTLIAERVIPILLESIQSSLGCDRVVWFARVGQSDEFRPDACAGTRLGRMETTSMRQLSCDGLILAALIGKVEIHIADSLQPKVKKNMPDWFDQLFPTTRSFLLVPVYGKGEAAGFVLADRSCTDPDGLEDQELSAIFAMRDQLASLFDALDAHATHKVQ